MTYSPRGWFLAFSFDRATPSISPAFPLLAPATHLPMHILSTLPSPHTMSP
jgi:hypothetical protein